jgi:hypothetical protein
LEFVDKSWNIGRVPRSFGLQNPANIITYKKFFFTKPVRHGGEVDEVFMQCLDAVVFRRAFALSLDGLLQGTIVLRAPFRSSLQVDQRILQVSVV